MTVGTTTTNLYGRGPCQPPLTSYYAQDSYFSIRYTYPNVTMKSKQVLYCKRNVLTPTVIKRDVYEKKAGKETGVRRLSEKKENINDCQKETDVKKTVRKSQMHTYCQRDTDVNRNSHEGSSLGVSFSGK